MEIDIETLHDFNPLGEDELSPFVAADYRRKKCLSLNDISKLPFNPSDFPNYELDDALARKESEGMVLLAKQ